jgi:hypothetical protein
VFAIGCTPSYIGGGLHTFIGVSNSSRRFRGINTREKGISYARSDLIAVYPRLRADRPAVPSATNGAQHMPLRFGEAERTKGSADVSPYLNLSRSLNSSIVLTSKELDALCVAVDCPASRAGLSTVLDLCCGTLWQQLDCPALEGAPFRRAPDYPAMGTRLFMGMARLSGPLCFILDRPALGAGPSASWEIFSLNVCMV